MVPPFIYGMKKLFSRGQNQSNINQSQGQAGKCKPVSSDAVYHGTKNFDLTRHMGYSGYGQYYYWESKKRSIRLRFWNPKNPLIGCVHSISLQNSMPEDIFNNDVLLMELANHTNVIRPIGKCLKSYAIIYQHMPQGYLDYHLRGPPNAGNWPRLQRQVLNWLTRIHIAKGIADGLEYIHETLGYIHTDISANNVFLDEDFVPKLASFGFAQKIIPGEYTPEDPVSVNRNIAEDRLVAPELRSRLATTKTDVYAYGTLLIYLFTGSLSKSLVHRVRVARPTEDFVRSIVDPSLGNQYSTQGLVHIIEAAQLCVHANPSNRFSIRGIQPMLRLAARC